MAGTWSRFMSGIPNTFFRSFFGNEIEVFLLSNLPIPVFFNTDSVFFNRCRSNAWNCVKLSAEGLVR